ncbi:hypothetical protein [Halomonas sp. SBBP1]|uniref:hypothetical protein n=2 Tax=unclassified Halomonas TaxID=2609666 RepID=UPI001CF15364|nr:hypothetical protein [Halomonas sp. SBBP1]MCA8865600.1 hypothetical protein [Halomonas sp. SBBP1]
MDKKEIDHQLLIFEKLSKINKSVFDYVTRITLAGLLNQIGETVGNTTIKVVAYVLFSLIVLQVIFSTYKLSDYVNGFLRERVASSWLFWFVFVFVTAVLMWLIHFFLIPAIGEVFKYYAELVKD